MSPGLRYWHLQSSSKHTNKYSSAVFPNSSMHFTSISVALALLSVASSAPIMQGRAFQPSMPAPPPAMPVGIAAGLQRPQAATSHVTHTHALGIPSSAVKPHAHHHHSTGMQSTQGGAPVGPDGKPLLVAASSGHHHNDNGGANNYHALHHSTGGALTHSHALNHSMGGALTHAHASHHSMGGALTHSHASHHSTGGANTHSHASHHSTGGANTHSQSHTTHHMTGAHAHQVAAPAAAF
jgi:hypothetical protein